MARLITRQFRFTQEDNCNKAGYRDPDDLFLCRSVLRELFHLPNRRMIWVSLWDGPAPDRAELKRSDYKHLFIDGEEVWMDVDTVEFVDQCMKDGVVYVGIEYEG